MSSAKQLSYSWSYLSPLSPPSPHHNPTRSRSPTASSAITGYTSISRARPPKSAISTATSSLPKSPTPFKAVQFEDTRRTKRDWNFFRQTAREVLWPHIDPEYQQELQGITDGLNAHGVKLDVYDVVALNAFEEVPDYYVPMSRQEAGACGRSPARQSRQLQRLRRDRQLHQGSPDRHRT